MAISPPSDIVLDVVNAASGADVAAARSALLQKTRETREAAGAAFDAGTPSPVLRPSAPEDPRRAAFVKFETMVLQSFMQSAMPEQASSVYGEGLAGDMWKSFLARELGEKLAESGGIGIADRMLPDFYKEGKAAIPLSGVNDSAARHQADEQALLAGALVDRLQSAGMRPLIGLGEDDAKDADAARTGLWKG